MSGTWSPEVQCCYMQLPPRPPARTSPQPRARAPYQLAELGAVRYVKLHFFHAICCLAGLRRTCTSCPD